MHQLGIENFVDKLWTILICCGNCGTLNYLNLFSTHSLRKTFGRKVVDSAGAGSASKKNTCQVHPIKESISVTSMVLMPFSIKREANIPEPGLRTPVKVPSYTLMTPQLGLLD